MGVQFVSDATISRGRVIAHITPGRPASDWVRARGSEWGLAHLYTRLTADAALGLVQKSEAVSAALAHARVVDAAADLVEDTPSGVGWWFAFHIQRQDGTDATVAVTGLGGSPAHEGAYIDEYGFGNATEAYTRIPLNMSDWVEQIATGRRWNATPAGAAPIGTSTAVPSSLPVAPSASSPVPVPSSVAPMPQVTPLAAPALLAPAPTPVVTTAPPATSLCGAPSNPWGYNFCSGYFISTPPSTFCSYFSCIASFWNGLGYVMQCSDLMFSLSGGRQGSCSYHDGNYRPLYAP